MSDVDKYVLTRDAAKRALIVADIARLEAESARLGMYKLAIALRKTLDIAADDAADASVAQTMTATQESTRPPLSDSAVKEP